jgi:hypothetical protein
MAKATVIRDIQRLQAMVASPNGHGYNGRHDETCYCAACKEARVKKLDRLYDRIEQMPPWPRGLISPETTPELCETIHAAFREALQQARGRAGQEGGLPDLGTTRGENL